jgi:LysM repeat protein
MATQRGRLSFAVLFLLLSFLLVACERPLQREDPPEVATDVTQDPNLAVDPAVTDQTAETTDPATTDTTTEQTAETGNTDTPRDTSEETAETTDTTAETTETSETTAETTETTAETTEESAETTETPAETTEESAETTEETTTESPAIPATHTVAAGENLYQIGLKYGVSWVTLASMNGLSNPNALQIGQTIKLPQSETADPEPTPSPLTESTYTVKAGDNLYRIGLAYGISWVQIAEANGIVNPNQIKQGQELKIPVNTPGPQAQFTHDVKAGETLFLISVRYGVLWTAIAEANEIESPYVILPGQTLIIPGE